MENKKVLKLSDPYELDEVMDTMLELCTDNGLYIGLIVDDGNGYEPYADVTVNLNFGDEKLPINQGYLDTNNMPELEKFITENKLGKFTGLVKQSGFCTYPLYEFDMDRVREFEFIYEED